jgi:hypothetical protein
MRVRRGPSNVSSLEGVFDWISGGGVSFSCPIDLLIPSSIAPVVSST